MNDKDKIIELQDKIIKLQEELAIKQALDALRPAPYIITYPTYPAPQLTPFLPHYTWTSCGGSPVLTYWDGPLAEDPING